MMALVNHLWQSTLFAGVVGLLTLALRRNRAALRYRLWLAASLKFLVPFALLIGVGRQIPRQVTQTPTATAIRPLTGLVENVGQPFLPGATGQERTDSGLSTLLGSVWLVGFLASGYSWLRQAHAARARIRSASALTTKFPIPVMTSSDRSEPGVVGVFRPVLLLPAGIECRLDEAQFAAVLAHEMCHVRRRDNLTAAIHLAVETVFWFYPLLRWIRERLMDEREQACDEEVLRGGSNPETYAQGILNVCRFYLESPAPCVARMTGADLKKRIESIMARPGTKDLDTARQLLLGISAAVVLAAPLAVGALQSPADAPAGRFEVASVKLNPSPDPRNMQFQTVPGGRLTAIGMPVYWLIAEAYGVPIQSTQLSGGPEWIRTTCYDIEAKAEAGTVPTDLDARARRRRMRPMLQALLAERFHLVVRRESKPMPVYILRIAKGGPKMPKSAIEEKDCGTTSDGGLLTSGSPCHGFAGGQGRGVHSRAADIADLIGFVENWSDRPILNRTELQGLYQFDTDGWIPMRGPGGSNEGLEDPVRPTLFTIFEKQLGLKLEPDKSPIDTFFIEQVERPTGN